jgi:hypothetical protein
MNLSDEIKDELKQIVRISHRCQSRIHSLFLKIILKEWNEIDFSNQ